MRKPETMDRELEENSEGRQRSRVKRAVFMVVEKANSGEQTGILR
jgi:hypothetical protein